MAYATFNATDSDKMSWMGVSRLVNSSWSDIHSHGSNSPVIASVEGISRYVMNIFKRGVVLTE